VRLSTIIVYNKLEHTVAEEHEIALLHPTSGRYGIGSVAHSLIVLARRGPSVGRRERSIHLQWCRTGITHCCYTATEQGRHLPIPGSPRIVRRSSELLIFFEQNRQQSHRTHPRNSLQTKLRSVEIPPSLRGFRTRCQQRGEGLDQDCCVEAEWD